MTSLAERADSALEGTRGRAALADYLNKLKKIAHVMSANPTSSVLWPHRAIIPIMFLS
jgi:hypothetical protein